MLAVQDQGRKTIPVYSTHLTKASLTASGGVSVGAPPPPITDRLFSNLAFALLSSEKYVSLQMGRRLNWIHNYKASKGANPFLLRS